MSEIQSAEEFVKFIDNNYINLGVITKQAMADLIRSRDKTIVERIRQDIIDQWVSGFEQNNYCRILDIFDSTLRDLGIE
jgi:hypothetical protein